MTYTLITKSINFAILILLVLLSVTENVLAGPADSLDNQRPRLCKIINPKIELLPTYTSAQVPLWMRSRQYGSIPEAGFSVGLIGGIKKEYLRPQKRLFDYGFGFQARSNLASQSTFSLLEAYVKGRFWIVQLKVGRSKDYVGLIDSALTSGAFAVAGNALGIPKIELSIPDFYTIPFLGRLFAFKGNFAHGTLGNKVVKIQDKYHTEYREGEIYFHQKSFYGQFGKPHWKLKLYGGFNHQVFWGGEKIIYGDKYPLSDFETIKDVSIGKTVHLDGIGFSKLGNSIGSIDFGILYNIKKTQLRLYRQFFYDVGGLYYLANVYDGLNGISFTNKNPFQNKKFRLNKICFEVFHSADQGGYFTSIPTPSGDEDYYNNFEFPQGWSYKGMGLGNPFISNKYEVRRELPHDSGQYFVNNRVLAFYLGSSVSIKSFDILVKVSYSKNFGTFATSVYGSSIGNIHHKPRAGIFPEVDQVASYLEVNKRLKRKFVIGIITALDVGKLYYNSAGISFKASKEF